MVIPLSFRNKILLLLGGLATLGLAMILMYVTHKNQEYAMKQGSQLAVLQAQDLAEFVRKSLDTGREVSKAMQASVSTLHNHGERNRDKIVDILTSHLKEIEDESISAVWMAW